MRAMVLVAGLGMAAVCGAQTLDPSLLEKKQSTQTGFHWDFDQDKATGKRFTIEGVFCLNGYTWSPIDYNESDAIIRQTVERIRPDFSSGELQNTLNDMDINVMWTFDNASGGWATNRTALAPRALPACCNCPCRCFVGHWSVHSPLLCRKPLQGNRRNHWSQSNGPNGHSVHGPLLSPPRHLPRLVGK